MADRAKLIEAAKFLVDDEIGRYTASADIVKALAVAFLAGLPSDDDAADAQWLVKAAEMAESDRVFNTLTLTPRTAKRLANIVLNRKNDEHGERNAFRY